jgi:ectoine hydroxylase-related dioxygenase (phytanoyl-CoA dioxygenase family)
MPRPENVGKLTLRQTVDNIGDPFPLTGKRLESYSRYWNLGYMVKFGAISKARIAAANIADMKHRFTHSNRKTRVFNENPSNVTDYSTNSRQQIVTKEYHVDQRNFLNAEQREFLNYCEETVKRLADEILKFKHPEVDKDLKVVESLLYSPSMNQDIQIPHRDLAPRYADKAILCLLALEEETTILLTRGTHIKGFKDQNYAVGRYELSVGDILFFHPLLIHAGDAYRNSNLRVHYYVFRGNTKWKINRTYLLDKKQIEMLRASEANLIRYANLMAGNRKRAAEQAEKKSKTQEQRAKRKIAMDAGKLAKRQKDNSEE